MSFVPKRGSILLAALCILAFTAAPANAALTIGGRGETGVITATASDSSLVSGAFAVTCGRSTISLPVVRARQLSGTIDFLNGTGRTCAESLLGSSCVVAVAGRITLVDTPVSSVTGVRAVFTVRLTAGFRLTVTCLGRPTTVSGPQNLGSCATWSQPGQAFTIRCSVVSSTTGGDGRPDATLFGTYRNTNLAPISVS